MSEHLELRDRRRGWLYAGCGMLVVSTDSFFVRWSRAEVWDLVFWFALISLVTFFVTGSRSESMNPIRSWRRFPIPLTAIAVLSTVSQISYITAVTRTTVSNAVVIVGASPVTVALVGRIFFSEKTGRRVWTAIALTFAGMTVIVAGSVGEPNLDGDLLAVAAVLAFSIGVNIWRRWPENEPNRWTIYGGGLVGGCCVILRVAVVSGWTCLSGLFGHGFAESVGAVANHERTPICACCGSGVVYAGGNRGSVFMGLGWLSLSCPKWAPLSAR